MLVTFAGIQLASDAFVRAPHSFSSFVPRAFGLRVYAFLDRVAPAAYVDETLAEDALQHGDIDLAQHYALRLSASPRRDDLLGRIAQAHGDETLALEYYFAAPDIERMQSALYRMLFPQPLRAYMLERNFTQRLIQLQTHPDAVADGYWYTGIYAAALHKHDEAMRDYAEAIQLAPFSTKYLVSAANEAFDDGHDSDATQYYQRGLKVNPSCGDCYAGLGLVALHHGDRAQAEADAARARTVQPQAGMLRVLERALATR